MGYIGMCGPKGYSFQLAVRVSILAILVINRVWFLRSSLELGMFFRGRAPSYLRRNMNIDFNIGLNYRSNSSKAGLK